MKHWRIHLIWLIAFASFIAMTGWEFDRANATITEQRQRLDVQQELLTEAHNFLLARATAKKPLPTVVTRVRKVKT